MSSAAPVICIVGPTASGKSELAQRLAVALDGEIVSADSMQIYRGMDIGTGKVPPSERRVPHFGLDLVDPGTPYSAALFQPYARACFADIRSRGHVPFLVGGTGLYVRAAIDDYRFPEGEQVDNPVREHYTRIAEEQGSDALWRLLEQRDPASADVIHPHNVRRVVRAFELLEEGKSYAAQKEALQHIAPYEQALFIGLAVDADLLRARINRRVDAMVEEGLVDEVTTLLQEGFREGLTAGQAIGYKEIVAALDGQCTLVEAIDAIKLATRRYAKRQRTWFRKDTRIRWIDANGDEDAMTAAALDVLRQEGVTDPVCE